MEAWMSDELTKSIPKEKLDFLSKLFTQSEGKSQKELMHEVLPLLKKAKEEGLTFTQAEMAAAIAAIRKHGSAEDNAQIDQLLKNVTGGRVQ